MSIVPEDRNQEDSRNIAVYQYLLTLTDLTVIRSDRAKGRTPEQSCYSVSSIATQWGTDRMFVQRTLENIHPELYPNKGKSKLPGLTLNKVVQILVELKNCSPEGQLTRENIIKALRLFTQLSPDDERKLDIKYHNTLLEKITDSIHELPEDIIPEVTAKVYEDFLAIKQYSDRNLAPSKNTKNTIEFYVKKHLKISISHRTENSNLFDTLCDKSLRRIKRIELQNGSDAFNYLINKKTINHSRLAIDTLTKCVVENHVLTEKLPIHIKYIEVRKNPALPLYLHGSTSVINEDFYDKSEDWINSIQGDVAESLKHLVSFTVKVHFYIDIPPEYVFSIKNSERSKISNLDIDINHIPGSDGKDRYVVDFFEETTGTGSTISQAIAAINRVLFWDIPLLEDYFPTPKNFIIHQENLGASSNAMIHVHNVIGLFKKNDLKIDSEYNDTEKKIKHIEQYVQESAAGNYCGFDILEVTAKSALYARLRAIKQIGIDNNEYIKQILNRIQEINALRKAKSLLDYFPFSSLAMKDYIQSNIFNNSNYVESSAQNWSMVAHDAHLEIAEAFLKEGLFMLGKKYLDLIGHLEQDSNKTDSLVRAKYYLCMFRYHYLNDLNPDQRANLHDEEAKRQAGEMLDNANNCLKECINKYHVIDEKQCAIFYDFFHILSRVNAHRAKLNLFREGHDANDKIRRAMRLFENARIFAARDGNPSLYSIWTAYQSWCYVMRGYLQSSDENQEYDKKLEDLNWAEKLLNHAKICYSEKGRKCYEDIKANAGKSYSNDSGSIYIDEVPFIVEVDNRKDIERKEGEPLRINMSVFRQDYSAYSSNSSGDKKIYLFGTQASLLLFVMGILKLCRNYDSDRDIKDAIEESNELFTYSWSIAEEGFKKKAAVDTKFERQFYIRELSTEQGKKISPLIPEFSICGLYPHRLSQFADFGKIFSIACALINLAIVEHSNTVTAAREKTIKENKELIEYLINRLTEHNCYFNSEETHKEQERYNGHLRSIYNQIQRHAYYLMKKGASFSSVKEARDQIVKDFFRIILTRAAVP